MSLLDLPSDLCMSILYEYLNVDNWKAVDVAHCSHSSRQELLSLFEKFPPIEVFQYHEVNALYSWLCLRNIGVKRLNVVSSMFSEAGMKEKFNLDKIEHIVIYYNFNMGKDFDHKWVPKYVHQVAKLVNGCVNLTALECSSEVLLLVNPLILQQLTQLHIKYGTMDTATYELILTNTTRLKKFCCLASVPGLLTEVLQRNVNLIDLKGSYLTCKAFLRNVASVHNRTLRQLKLHQMQLDEIDSADALEIIKCFPAMVSLSVQYTCYIATTSLHFHQYDGVEVEMDNCIADDSPALWTTLSFSSLKLTDMRIGSALRYVSHNSPHLHTLSLVDCIFEEESMLDVMMKCKNLTDLTLHGKLKPCKLEGISHCRFSPCKSTAVENALSLPNKLKRVDFWGIGVNEVINASCCLNQFIVTVPRGVRDEQGEKVRDQVKKINERIEVEVLYEEDDGSADDYV